MHDAFPPITGVRKAGRGLKVPDFCLSAAMPGRIPNRDCRDIKALWSSASRQMQKELRPIR
jgi:hypothetical protein